MRFSVFPLTPMLAMIGAARAGFHQARSLSSGQNMELGELQGLHELHALMGRDIGQGIEYEDVSEYETIDWTIFQKRGARVNTTNEANVTIATTNECVDLTGRSKGMNIKGVDIGLGLK